MWIDGKPLYQKTFFPEVKNIMENWQLVVEMPITNIVRNMTGMISLPDYDFQLNWTYVDRQVLGYSNYYLTLLNSTISNGNVSRKNGSVLFYTQEPGSVGQNKLRLTLQYTKTTD